PKVVIGKKICNEALIEKTTEEQGKINRDKIAKENFKDFF
ncbi:unnamed protein product, partial [marine sediment metagenome]